MGARSAARAAVLAVALVLAAVGCKADTPELTDASDIVGNECTPYADELVAYAPIDGGDTDVGQNALGMPDEQLVTVGPDDALTVGFFGLGGVAEEDGLDLHVHATGPPASEAKIYFSADGEVYETAGTIGFDEDGEPLLEVDIANTATVSVALYVQLVGVLATISVDAFEALQTPCPETD